MFLFIPKTLFYSPDAAQLPRMMQNDAGTVLSFVSSATGLTKPYYISGTRKRMDIPAPYNCKGNFATEKSRIRTGELQKKHGKSRFFE